jgi:hypothetical protein
MDNFFASQDEGSDAISFAGQRRGSSDWAGAIMEMSVAQRIDADSARYTALGEHYARGDTADTARYVALGEYYAEKGGADSERYAALGAWYLAKWEAAAEASAARYEGLAEYYGCGTESLVC